MTINIEVLKVLRRAIRDDIDIRVVGDKTWRDAYNGIIKFKIEGYEIHIFKDAGIIDFVDYVRTPDGLVGTFQGSWDSENDPINLLSGSELDTLETRLFSADN